MYIDRELSGAERQIMRLASRGIGYVASDDGPLWCFLFPWLGRRIVRRLERDGYLIRLLPSGMGPQRSDPLYRAVFFTK